MKITKEDLKRNIKLTFISDTYIEEAKKIGIVTIRDDELNLNKAFLLETNNDWHFITETDLKNSSLTIEKIETAALECTKNSKLIAISFTDISEHIGGLLFPYFTEETEAYIVKAVSENNILEDKYESLANIPYGASLIYNTDLLDEFCQSTSTEEIVILPCSTSELICLSFDSEIAKDIDYLMSMIELTNENCLNHVTELSSIPYFYKKGDKVIKYETELSQDIER